MKEGIEHMIFGNNLGAVNTKELAIRRAVAQESKNFEEILKKIPDIIDPEKEEREWIRDSSKLLVAKYLSFFPEEEEELLAYLRFGNFNFKAIYVQFIGKKALVMENMKQLKEQVTQAEKHSLEFFTKSQELKKELIEKLKSGFFESEDFTKGGDLFDIDEE